MSIFVVRFGYISVFVDDIRDDERTIWRRTRWEEMVTNAKCMHIEEKEVLLS
jgi:hypothetical protein